MLFLVLVLTGFASTAQSSDAKLIIGRWQSIDDRKSEMVFTKDRETDYYGKKQELVSTYRLQHDSLVTVDVKSGDTSYYIITSLSSKNLALMYLARGNILTYRRVVEKK